MLSVLASSTDPVWRLVLLTLPPATNAPLASATAPAMPPSFSCACIETDQTSSRHASAGHLANCSKLFISRSPSRYLTGYSSKSRRQRRAQKSDFVFRVLYQLSCKVCQEENSQAGNLRDWAQPGMWPPRHIPSGL